jgi:uncharacterized protein (TIGR03067 family)
MFLKFIDPKLPSMKPDKLNCQNQLWLASVIFLLFLIFSCNSTKNVASTQLNGLWLPVQQEMGGKQLPQTIFEKQTLIIHDSTYTFTAESLDKGVLKYSNGKMDIYGKEGVNAGRHFTAIYKLENEQLVICYNLKGDSYPETFETKANSTLFRSTFKKG